MVTNVKTPCPKCPFRRDVEPGALGGATVEKFLGQAHGPFMLPCHAHCDFDDPNWKANVMETPQCAGAAMYRGSVPHLRVGMPPPIHVLSPDAKLVFSSPAEFMAHHWQWPLEKARCYLLANTTTAMLARELASSQVRRYPAPKLNNQTDSDEV